MASVIVLYTKPDDMDGFSSYYRDTHGPLVGDVPGLQSFGASRIVGTPRGTEAPYVVKAELHWESMDDLQAAMRSEEMMKVSRDAMEMCQRFGMNAEILVADDF